MFGFFVSKVGCSHDVFVCLVSKLIQSTVHERPSDCERDVSTTMTIRAKKRWECSDEEQESEGEEHASCVKKNNERNMKRSTKNIVWKLVCRMRKEG